MIKDISKDIVFEDDDIIVVEKRAGIATESARLSEQDMVSLIKNYRVKKGEPPYVGLINRLDQPVEGLLLIAKNSLATSKLSEQMKKHVISKKYYCVCWGAVLEDGELKDYLLIDHKNNTATVVTEGTKDAKEARLKYEVIDKNEEKSLLRVTLFTGRHHQIRVQMAHMGHPIIGDRKYGKEEKDSRYLPLSLCSYELSFEHPSNNKKMCFTIKPVGECFLDYTF